MEPKIQLSFSECSFSPEELEQFRDKDGFIDLSRAGIQLKEGSRNQVGAIDIFKYWVNFNGVPILLKQEKMLDNEPNYSIYSELLMHEMAEKLGIESAQCDLFKWGEQFKGIMSYMAIEPSRESLVMTDELVGNPPLLEPGGDIVDYVLLEEKIKELLLKWGLSDNEVEQVIGERRKQKVLQLFSCEMDNHAENEGFVVSRDETGKVQVKVAPMFDNECSFGLNNTKNDLEIDEMQDSITKRRYTDSLRRAYKIISTPGGKVGGEIISFIKETKEDELVKLMMGYGSHRDRISLNGLQLISDEEMEIEGMIPVDSTLHYLMFHDDDECRVGETLFQLIKTIEPQKVILKVEETIKAKIPEVVKSQFETFYQMRRQAMRFIYSMEQSELEGIGEMVQELKEYANQVEINTKDNSKQI